MNVILLITEGAKLVATLSPVAAALADKIKGLLESEGDFEVVMSELTTEATDANTATRDAIAEWRAEHPEPV